MLSKSLISLVASHIFQGKPLEHVLFHEIDHLWCYLISRWQSVTNALMFLYDFGPRIHPIVEASHITAAFETSVSLDGSGARLKVRLDASIPGGYPCTGLGRDRAERDYICGRVDAIGPGCQDWVSWLALGAPREDIVSNLVACELKRGGRWR